MAQRGGRRPAKYRQIAADLRARIERGEWPVDTQMPTQAELAARYEAAGGTIDKALRVLRDAGIAETVHGMGTFVRKPPDTAQPGFGVVMSRIDRLEAQMRAEFGDLRERLDALEKPGPGEPRLPLRQLLPLRV